MVDNAIHADILPLPAKAEDEAAWVDRLLLVVSHLGPRAFTALLSLMGLSDFGQCVSWVAWCGHCTLLMYTAEHRLSDTSSERAR
jgi:hypothetical protein